MPDNSSNNTQVTNAIKETVSIKSMSTYVYKNCANVAILIKLKDSEPTEPTFKSSFTFPNEDGTKYIYPKEIRVLVNPSHLCNSYVPPSDSNGLSGIMVSFSDKLFDIFKCQQSGNLMVNYTYSDNSPTSYVPFCETLQNFYTKFGKGFEKEIFDLNVIRFAGDPFIFLMRNKYSYEFL